MTHVRNAMRQTDRIERAAKGINPWGGYQTAARVLIATALPCKAWEAQERVQVGGGEFYSVSKLKMRVPLGSDIQFDDVVMVDAYTARVEAVMPRRGHLVVELLYGS